MERKPVISYSDVWKIVKSILLDCGENICDTKSSQDSS